MGNSKVEFCKMIYETALKGKSVSAFNYRNTKGVGEELTHVLSGEKAFLPPQRTLSNTNQIRLANEPVYTVYPSPGNIRTAGGEEIGSITQEEFNKLRKARIIQENPHTYRDTSTGNVYYNNSEIMLGGSIPRMQTPDGQFRTIDKSVWEKLISLFES